MHARLHRRDILTGMLSATAALAVTRTALAQPVSPGAIPTQAYLAMATRGGLFLENTARDAHAKTSNPAVRSFARAEVIEQVALSSKIDAYTGGAPVPSARGPAGPGGLIGAPLALATGAAGAAAGVVGGTIGAVAGGPGPAAMTSDEQKAQIEAQLSGQQPGPAYDAAFVGASLQGHREAQAINVSYAQSGEDPGLRRIARGALPLIDRHIAILSRMQGRMQG